MAPGELKTEILKDVADGKYDFQADDGSDAARVRFQTKARSIIELGRDGYLEGVRSTEGKRDGPELY